MGEKGGMKKEAGQSKAQTSPVWSYFKVCEENAVLADCLLCGVRMSRGGNSPNRCGTTNLRRHILFSHNITLPSYVKKNTGISPRLKTKRLVTCPNFPTALIENKTHKKKKPGRKKKSSLPVTRKKQEQIKEEEEMPQTEPVMCIRWNTYLDNMTSSLPSLLQEEQFVDVTLACEGQSLKCHKILLAACSPYFYKLLNSAACKHPIIVFKDYHLWELQALVTFMYCGEVNVPQSQLPRILRTAEALQIKGLAKTPSLEETPPSEAEEEEQPSLELDTAKPSRPLLNKRKRKRSSREYCKKLKTSKLAPKVEDEEAVKCRGTSLHPIMGRLRSAKKGRPHSSENKLTLSPDETCLTDKGSREGLSPYEEQASAQLADLLTSDTPNMFNDILSTSEITGGVGLPDRLSTSGVDSIFPLVDEVRVDVEEEKPLLKLSIDKDESGMKSSMDEDRSRMKENSNETKSGMKEIIREDESSLKLYSIEDELQIKLDMFQDESAVKLNTIEDESDIKLEMMEDDPGLKVNIDEDESGFSSFLSNGLSHTDQFDLLRHLSPECNLDVDEDDGR